MITQERDLDITVDYSLRMSIRCATGIKKDFLKMLGNRVKNEVEIIT